jgi:hypothetical protein
MRNLFIIIIVHVVDVDVDDTFVVVSSVVVVFIKILLTNYYSLIVVIHTVLPQCSLLIPEKSISYSLSLSLSNSLFPLRFDAF